MRCMKLAAFTSDLPDDQIEDDDDIVQFGGQGVSGVIAQGLRAAGFKVQEPQHMGMTGWEFSVKGRYRLSLRVSDLGDFFILGSFFNPFFPFFLDRQEQFEAAVLRGVTDSLRRDGRFRDLLWFNAIGDDYGFTDPVADAPGSVRTTPPDAWNWQNWRE